MKKIEVTLEGQKVRQGEDDYYKENIDIIVKEDEDDKDVLKFDADGTKFFISKEELKTLIRIYNLN